MTSVDKKAHYDVTECIICAEAYTDPRQLPCLHTYCLRCIESWNQDKKTEAGMDCPMCRRQFEYPQDGMSNLPRDRFIGKMLMVRRMSSKIASHLQCDVCDRQTQSVSSSQRHQSAAKIYCVDCCDSLCKPCALKHASEATSAGHELVKLRKGHKHSRADKLLPVPACHRHLDQPRQMYCLDCSVTACRKCLASQHKSHRAGEVDWLADRLRDHIGADIARMQQSGERCRSDLERLRRQRDDLELSSDEAAAAVSRAAARARDAVDQQERRLQEHITSSKTEQTRQLDNHIGACDLQVKVLDSFTRYCREVKEKGAASDVASTAAKLKRRAAELLEFDADKLSHTRNRSHDLYFIAADWLDSDHVTLLGHVVVSDDTHGESGTLPSAPPTEQTETSTTLAKVIARQGRNSVCGIATDGVEVFIARNNSAKIDVWNAKTLLRQRLLPIPGLRSLYGFSYDVWGFTLCRQSACLYVGYQANVIRRLAINRPDASGRPESAGSVASKDHEWSVPGEAKGLSVTRDKTVLVAIAGKCKLKELARQYIAEHCGTLAHSELYRTTAVNSQALQSYLRRRLGRHDFDFVCNCVIYQLFTSVSGPTQIDLTAYIESDDCKHALHEYSTEGHLVREIFLPGDVTEPQHAVRLGSHYVVSHAGSLHRVCLVGEDGTVESTYGRRCRRSGSASYATAQLTLNEPRDVAVDAAGRILVADKDNNRVLVLEEGLTAGHQLLLPTTERPLHGPWSLCLDQSRDRLYVGEWEGGRVLVFDNITNVTLS